MTAVCQTPLESAVTRDVAPRSRASTRLKDFRVSKRTRRKRRIFGAACVTGRRRPAAALPVSLEALGRLSLVSLRPCFPLALQDAGFLLPEDTFVTLSLCHSGVSTAGWLQCVCVCVCVCMCVCVCVCVCSAGHSTAAVLILASPLHTSPPNAT